MRNTAHCHPDWHYKHKKTGASNVKLFVNINGSQKRYGTNINVTKEEWAKLKNQGLKEQKLIEIRNAIRDIDADAVRILKKLSVPSFEDFEFEFYNKTNDGSNDQPVSAWFDKYMAHLLATNHPYSYCESIQSAKNSLLLFKPNLKFSQVTPAFLEKYRFWMEEVRGKKEPTTQGYLRNLRTVFNYAISKKAVHRDRNPFGTSEFKIGSNIARKKALNKSQVLHLMSIDYSHDSAKEHARDLFVFQYLSNGMNILDVCKLKMVNFEDDPDFLTFRRSKTRSTSKNGKPIRIYLSPESKQILEKWGNKNRDKDDYLFPYFNALKGQHNTSREERYLSNLLTKTVNKYLKRIGKEQGLPFKLTSGISRHSYAAVLKNKGYTDVLIGDGLGHEDPKTTQNYLGSLDDNLVKEMSESLL